MIELKVIIDICKEIFGVDIYEKNRTEIYVAARFFYFFYATKKTRYSLSKIGAEVGVKHCTVHHGRKRYLDFKEQYPEFRKFFIKAESSVEKAFNDILGFDVSGMNQYEIEIEVLKKRLQKQQNQNAQLKSRIRKYTIEMHPTLTKLINEADAMEMEEFVKYKVIPHLNAIMFYRNKKLTAQ